MSAGKQATSVGIEFPKEQARVRELLQEYRAIGPAGTFGAMMLEQTLQRAAPTPAVPATLIAEIEQLAKAATPGPWRAQTTFPVWRTICKTGQTADNATHWVGAGDVPMRHDSAQHDAVFVAACDPQTILALCALARGASHDAAQVTRFEVIDHRGGVEARGREFVAYECRVELSYQDKGRTLKVFLDDAARSSQGGTE